MQELVGPGNLADVAAAAQDTGTTIPVHLYLFQHYSDPWGWEFKSAGELQARPKQGAKLCGCCKPAGPHTMTIEASACPSLSG